MPRLSSEYLGSLELMTASYHAALLAQDPGSPSGHARNYLLSRGIGPAEIASYRLGIVDGSHDEHEFYTGMIAIPYITRLAGVVSFKFRRPHECHDCEHAKYLGPYDTRIYNPLAFDRADQRGYIAITEGEINAVTLDGPCGIPAVGIPGAKSWQAHPEWRELFRGYRRVILFPDADEEGEALMGRVVKDIDTISVVRLPNGADANKALLEIGTAEIRKAAGISD